MRNDKNKAIELRLKGNSYSQISLILGIPKSTLSYWLKDLKLSQRAKSKINIRVSNTSIRKLVERNKQRSVTAEKRHESIRIAAKENFKKLSSNSLFITGVALYWGEGYKQGANDSKWKSIDFANTDPHMIEIMIKFFKKFFPESQNKIIAQLMLHDKSKINSAINFWHKITGIPKANFLKTYTQISHSSLQKRKKRLQYGTIHIRINDVEKFFTIIGWIDGLKEKFNINEAYAS